MRYSSALYGTPYCSIIFAKHDIDRQDAPSTEHQSLREFLSNDMKPPYPSPTSRDFPRTRFWLVALAGALIGEAHVIGRLFDGHIGEAPSLILTILLLLWLRRGSDWARWLLAALLLFGGAMHLFMSMEMIGIPFSAWSYDYQVAPLLLAVGLYLALAKQDFQPPRRSVA